MATIRSRVLIVLDGLGDLPHPALAGKTPLEAAHTPHLDRLASLGRLGTLEPVRRGVAPESDAGVLSLLGYDPERESPGRGVLEALGAGVKLGPKDVALRLNFATADASGRIVDQRVGRGLSTAESEALARSLTEADLVGDMGIEARFLATVGHRGVVYLSPREDGALSGEVSNSDPYYERVGRAGHAVKPERAYPREIRPVGSGPEAARTADALNRITARSADLLESHPTNAQRASAGKLVANRILMRDAGGVPSSFPTFQSRHHLAAAAVTEMPVERGIAGLLGLRDIFVGPMGTDVAGGLRHRAEVVRQALLHDPFVYVHLKGPDEPGHDGDAPRKRDVVERLDQFFMGPFLEGLNLDEVLIAVTADHSTPCILKGHSDDPVPLLVAGGTIRPTGAIASKFSEGTARAGSLGEILGRDLVPMMLADAPSA